MKEISENAKKLLIENLEKLPYAEKQAKDKNSSLKKIITYFIIKDNIARLKFDGKLPKNTYIKKINPDFSETEKILGFEIHPELKELLSLDFCIHGHLKNEYIGFWLCGGNTDIVKLFYKSDYFNHGDFCTIGSDDMFSLEFNNDTGEIYIRDYEYNTYHHKIADSVRELLLNADSIWSHVRR